MQLKTSPANGSMPKNDNASIGDDSTLGNAAVNSPSRENDSERSFLESMDGPVDLSAILSKPFDKKNGSSSAPDSQNHKHHPKMPTDIKHGHKGNEFLFDLPILQLPQYAPQPKKPMPQPPAPIVNHFVDFNLTETFAEFGSPAVFIYQSFDTIADAIESRKSTISLIYAAQKSEKCATGKSRVLRFIFRISPINRATYYYALQTNIIPQEAGIDKFLFSSCLKDILMVFNLKSVDESKVYAVSRTLTDDFMTIADKKKESYKREHENNHHMLGSNSPVKMPQGFDIKTAVNDAIRRGQEAINQVLDSNKISEIVSEDKMNVKRRINTESSSVSDLY